ncbi:MAG: DUF692 family protein [Saprospiraceae bacterium]|nr:DUF692 family protein [Saprospiraceae bacterium]
MIYCGTALNLDHKLLSANLPLLANSKLEAIEWSFDALYKLEQVPDWFDQLVKLYSNQKRLIGHGVFFSIFSGKFSSEQKKWLEDLKILSNKYRFDHITEHFGFMTGEDFHKGAPLSIPMNLTALRIGQDRLKRIQDVSNCPIGIENLAFAFNVEDVKRQGEFLNDLLSPINGFMILDLHNLYCQAHNFKIDIDNLLQYYPLELVREIHISGGSWEDDIVHYNEKIRRDTHDDSVPSEVYICLESCLLKLDNLKYVILEQLSNALESESQQKKYQSDFYKILAIVKNNKVDEIRRNDFHPSFLDISTQEAFEDLHLYQQQAELSHILVDSKNLEEAKQKLSHSSLRNSDWNVELWQDNMLYTAMSIAQKWK